MRVDDVNVDNAEASVSDVICTVTGAGVVDLQSRWVLELAVGQARLPWTFVTNTTVTITTLPFMYYAGILNVKVRNANRK